MTAPLTLPSIGSTNWGTAVNNNWTYLNNAFTSSASFSGTTNASSSTVGALTVGNGTASTSVAIGAGNVYIGGTTSASSSITGALIIGNGTASTSVGIGSGNVNIGGALSAAGASTFTNTTSASSAIVGALVVGNGTASTSVAIGSGNMYIGGTTSSSGSTTGALIIGNGTASTSVGIGGGNINAGTSILVGYNSATSPSIYLNGAAGNDRLIWWETAASSRWVMYCDSTAESGSNAGSDLVIQNYSDSGVYIASPFVITRSSSAVSIGGASLPPSAFPGNTIWGVQNGSSASAGQVGEVISSYGSGVNAAASGSSGNVTSISLTPGDWLISGNVNVAPNTSTGLTANSTYGVSIVTTSAGTGATGLTQFITTIGNLTATGNYSVAIPMYHIVISSTTTYYLTAYCSYVAGTPQYYGNITAVRLR